MNNKTLDAKYVIFIVAVAFIFFFTLVTLLLLQNYIATKKHAESKGIIETVKTENMSITDDRDRLLQERDQLRDKLFNEQGLRKILESDLSIKQTEIKDLQSRALTLQKDMDQIEREKNAIELRLAKARTQGSMDAQTQLNLEEELRITKAQLNKLSTTVQATHSAEKQFSNESKRLHEQLAATEAKLQATEQRLARTEELLSIANNTIESITTDNLNLQDEKQTLTWKLLRSDTKLSICNKKFQNDNKCEDEINRVFDEAESSHFSCVKSGGGSSIVVEVSGRPTRGGKYIYPIGSRHVLIVCDPTLPERQ